MDIKGLVDQIINLRGRASRSRSVLVGISGIDASGKGYVTRLIDQKLHELGFRSAAISVDGWLNLPNLRFDPSDLPGNFYRNCIRFTEMFDRLILPLKQTRSAKIEADHTDETATAYRKYLYDLRDVDIVLLEGIFLFKREYVQLFDLKIWIECSFDKALTRAISRSQEGLSPDETIIAYRRIYFPAQKLHFAIDRPQQSADIRFSNF